MALGFWEGPFDDLEQIHNKDKDSTESRQDPWVDFILWCKTSFNLYLLISLTEIWHEPFKCYSTNVKTEPKSLMKYYDEAWQGELRFGHLC